MTSLALFDWYELQVLTIITAIAPVCPSIVERALGREKNNGHLKG